MDGWREASEQSWRQARWINGIDAVRTVFEAGKTIVCGHWHTSYGHSKYEGLGTEFGKDADFSPYIAPGIIALEAYGQDLLASENAVMTLYGPVARKDGSMLLTPADAPDQGKSG